MVTSNLNNKLGTITLTPNRSASWRANKRIILLLGTFTLSVASVWAWLGVWAVLPFAGVEVALLAYFLYRVSRQTYRQQVITLETPIVSVELGIRYPTQRWALKHENLYFSVAPPAHPLDGPVVSICDNQHQIELTDFLNAEDRKLLVSILKDNRLPLTHNTQSSQFQA